MDEITNLSAAIEHCKYVVNNCSDITCSNDHKQLQSWLEELLLIKQNPSKSPIIQIGNQTIDISKVVRVSGVGGDSDWLTYTIFFDNGSTFSVYENRHYASGTPLDQMPRAKFIELWNSFKSSN